MQQLFDWLVHRSDYIDNKQEIYNSELKIKDFDFKVNKILTSVRLYLAFLLNNVIKLLIQRKYHTGV